MAEYIIKCDLYERIPKVNHVGLTTLTITQDGFKEKPVTAYLRNHDNMSAPRLNTKELAETFDSKKYAEKIAKELTCEYTECKCIASVEKL